MLVRQKHELVQALLSCRSMNDRSVRDTIVNELPDFVKNSIGRNNTDRIDVANIVIACLSYVDAIEALVEAVRMYEGPSKGMQEVDTAMTHLAAQCERGAAESVEIPFVIAAMNRRQASVLFEESDLGNCDIADVELAKFRDFKGMFPEKEVSEWLSHYADEPESWTPHTYPGQTIGKIISDALNTKPSLHWRLSLPPMRARFRSAEFFLEQDEALQEKTWQELRTSGGIVVVDAVSLFHPNVRKSLVDSGVGFVERIALLIILPFNLGTHPAYELVESELHSQMRPIHSRFSKHFDRMCELGGGDLRSLKRWLSIAVPDAVETVKREKPRIPNLYQVWSDREAEPKGIHNVFYGQGGRP